MTDSSALLLQELKALKQPSYEFDFATVFGFENSGLKNGKAYMRVLTVKQQIIAANEAHNALVELLSLQSIADTKEGDLKRIVAEHVQFAAVLRFAITNAKGLPIFGSTKDLHELFNAPRLEALWSLYVSCVERYRGQPGQPKDFDSEFVLKIFQGVADLDETVNRATQEETDPDRIQELQAFPNALLSQFSRNALEELIIRMGIIAKGCGLFNASAEVSQAEV
jgi:hypothetical protein